MQGGTERPQAGLIVAVRSAVPAALAVKPAQTVESGWPASGEAATQTGCSTAGFDDETVDQIIAGDADEVVSMATGVPSRTCTVRPVSAMRRVSPVTAGVELGGGVEAEVDPPVPGEPEELLATGPHASSESTGTRSASAWGGLMSPSTRWAPARFPYHAAR